MSAGEAHWDRVYAARASSQMSWYQARPETSLAMIARAAAATDEPIIDVGGGTSLLIDALLAAGYSDLTVLDISQEALGALRERLGDAPARLLRQDVTGFVPERRYGLWHDRAVFHFLCEPAQRAAYRAALHRGLRAHGHVVLATFATTGPERCSGLPVRRYDAHSLAAELGAEYQLVESREEPHRTPGGASQQFLYCRFRFCPVRGEPALD